MTDAPAARPILNGRYELHRRIARGGMADVFLAKDQLLDRPVAVKVLFPQFAAEESFVARFRREAQAAANLNHPNIVAVYDWGEHEDTYFIVMEYIEGQTLAELIAGQGTLSPDVAADVAIEVSSALGFAHRNGTVHRDVKPGNIMINQSGQVKVADFGIARAFGGGDDELTQTGSVMGTASYFSPEQAQGKPVDPRSDLYSLGVVLYEMLTGEPPFTGHTPVAIAFKHVQETAPRVRQRNPSAPPALDAVVDKLLHKDPAMRYPAADELRADLRRFRSGQPLEGVTNGVAAAGAVGAPHAAAVTGDAPTMMANQAIEQVNQLPPDATMAMPNGPSTAAMPTRGPDTGRSRAVIDTSRAVPASAAVSQEEPVEEYYEAPNRTGVFVIMLALLLAGLVVLILYISSTFGASDDSEEAEPEVVTTAVPDVIGKGVTDAEVDLRVAGFEVVSELQENPDVDPNIVFAQDPPAGTEAEADTVITIFVSKAAETERVPRLEGLSEEEANDRLVELGLTVDIRREASEIFEEGQVIRTEPGENAEVNKGTQVLLIVSTGPDQVEIPLLAGMDQATATSTLTGLNFSDVEIRPEGSGTVDVGRVIRSEPAAGQLASIDGTIIVFISSGPDQVQVPAVLGLSREAAEAQLGGEDFQLVVQFVEQPLAPGDERIGLVVNTNPGPGSMVLQGSTIMVAIGIEQVEETTTTTTAPPDSTTSTSVEETTTTTAADG
ncbi:MAG: Stk1 family PASTA domain-containing Ser/Thr kinase [Actinomycetota bacterium]